MERTSVQRDKLVAHLRDGQVYKGYSSDFDGLRPRFHVYSTEAPVASSRLLDLDELKAIFYVRSWGRGPGREDRTYTFGPSAGEPGRRAAVQFRDGERIWGYVMDEHLSEAGFFLIPANPDDNNIKIYVVRSATEEVAYLPEKGERSH
jgi:hypothetical protein